MIVGGHRFSVVAILFSLFRSSGLKRGRAGVKISFKALTTTAGYSTVPFNAHFLPGDVSQPL